MEHAMLYSSQEQDLALAQMLQSVHDDGGIFVLGEIGLDYFHANTADILLASEQQGTRSFSC